VIDQNRLNVIAADLKYLRPGLGKHSLANELGLECRLRGLEYDLKTVGIAVNKVLHLKERV
jgi:hypothetical protein